MSTLKIGFVLDDTLDSADGIQQYLQTNGRWLAQAGHEVHYLVGETKRKDLKNVHSLSRNIRVRSNKNRMTIPLPAQRSAIRQLLEHEKFDVLHVQMPYSPWLAGRVIQFAPASTAIVGTFHIMPASWLQVVGAKLLRLIDRRTLRRFDSIVSVSEPGQKFAASSLRVESTVLPNSVNFEELKKGRKLAKYDDGKTNIVTMGRLVERKGANYLIEAFAQLNDESCRLIICGKGPLLEQLQNRVDELGITDQVIFEGFIEEKDKADYLATADLAVYPSTGGESFGIVLIEAVAAGAGVVLAGDNPGYHSVMAGHPDALFDPVDTASFAKRLKTFVSDTAARQKLHEWQQAHFKQFDVAVVAPKLVELYNQTLQHKHKVR